MRKIKKFKLNIIAAALIFFLSLGESMAVEFNIDVLDSNDRSNIDLSRFSQAGYIMPGQYQMQVMVNNQNIAPHAYMISFIEPQNKNSGETKLPQACLTEEIIKQIALTTDAEKKVTYWNDNQCADLKRLKGVEIAPNLAEGILNINMPQAWLEYSDSSWLPPSRWDHGIPGLLVDYNVNAYVDTPYQGKQTQTVSYNGTIGANISAWRLRADYQGNLNHTTGIKKGTNSNWGWSRIYMYRAIPQLQAKLTVGESYTSSDIFETWRYTGASLESDDRMLPPKLRGYAPQISGIADTNARVIVSQLGRILYDSTVPAGPFTIQDLDSSVRGRLDVEVIEQDGRKKSFRVDTASVPYLTRPGRIRYKLVSGRPRTIERSTEGPVFGGAELSWGISNSWSLYGGGVVAGDYNSFAIGLGRDLNQFGTLSADVTQSISNTPARGSKQGKSWRLSYSKRFDEAETDITFAGYRFSERNYMTMQQYLDARYRDNYSYRDKERYSISVNKFFEDWKTSVGLQYDRQTYWDRPSSNYYTLSMNKYIDLKELKNVSLGLSASRSKYFGRNDDNVFFRASIPLGSNGWVNYNTSYNDDRYSHTIGYSDRARNGLDSYNINVGLNHGGDTNNQAQISAYYSNNNHISNLSANFSFLEKGYKSFGLGASGGATFTAKGAALHSGGMNGGTRLLVDTDGIDGVPIDNGRVLTNPWGIGVVTDISSYYRNTTAVDLNKLPENMEASRSVVESVLTEGAIGYRKFEVLKGQKLFALLRLKDGSYPPFGASVSNKKGKELGIVSDTGLAWLSGVSEGETLKVSWDGQTQCMIDIPKKVNVSQQLLLLCNAVIPVGNR
ncbi:fimbria/pilus outer membrane usher protein [Providencia alcalifaciens]|uniref:fimbria/pilus outer membrane usher protein n=1 Tax=Providencia alcalifaciens TaxID=126385 RepID=UPI00044F561F|nr:fimbria/pilus outer membrane usher protein [Providencia alcalifaciens]EUD09003.1 outer membrane usher protein PapC [Providencia alcalifaciens R90-1475]